MGIFDLPGLKNLGDAAGWVEENTGITPQMMMTIASGAMNAATANPVGVASDVASLYGQATGNETIEEAADAVGMVSGIGGAVKGLAKGAAKEGVKAATKMAATGAKDAVMEGTKAVSKAAVPEIGKQMLEQGGTMALDAGMKGLTSVPVNEMAGTFMQGITPAATSATAQTAMDLSKTYKFGTAAAMNQPQGLANSSFKDIYNAPPVNFSKGPGVGQKLSDIYEKAKPYAEQGAALYQGYNDMKQSAMDQLQQNPQAQQMLARLRQGGGQGGGFGANTVASRFMGR